MTYCMHILFCFANLDDLHNQQRLELDQKAMDLERAHEATRHALCLATKEFNKVQVNQ